MLIAAKEAWHRGALWWVFCTLCTRALSKMWPSNLHNVAHTLISETWDKKVQNSTN